MRTLRNTSRILAMSLAAIGCASGLDYADLERGKSVETLSGDEREALCRETERVFSPPAVADALCFGKNPLDRSGTADQIRTRCESQQRSCREHPVVPLDCTVHDHCAMTVADYDRCLREMARALEVAKEISCEAYTAADPPQFDPCRNDPADDPCAFLIERCPGLDRSRSDWGRCR